jgi:predicted kinase
METDSPVSVSQASSPLLVVPRQTLMVLCGPAGSGKSTFAQRFVERHAAQGCRPTTIVSSDTCRALICDDPTNQQINRDAFDLFYYIIYRRLVQRILTIADSTALFQEARRKLLTMAQRQQYTTCLLFFKTSLQTCIARDLHADRSRVVGEQVIVNQFKLLNRALQDIPQEGWDQIYYLDEQNSHFDLTIESERI